MLGKYVGVWGSGLGTVPGAKDLQGPHCWGWSPPHCVFTNKLQRQMIASHFTYEETEALEVELWAQVPELR